MVNKLDVGFIKADDRNLPIIDMFMVCEYIKGNDNFSAGEIRNAKLAMSSRENYGDQAIGYVSLKRDGQICTIQCRVCPEHNIRQKDYKVSLTLNETDEKIKAVKCHDCIAANGGCKHAIAFLMWIHRKSQNPSVTETQCYWKKSALSAAGTTKKFITVSELKTSSTSFDGNSSIPTNSLISTHRMPSSVSNRSRLFLEDLLKTAEDKQLDSQLTRHFYKLRSNTTNCLSIHQLILEFKSTGKQTANDFIQFASAKMTTSLCNQAEISSRTQSDSLLWYELRYGRITASKIHETTRCKTRDGALTQQILGAAKVFTTKFMERGKNLEGQVLKVVQEKYKLSCQNSGLFLSPDFPILGASPDGIGNDFIVEIKCPSKQSTKQNFIKNGQIASKCRAQIQLQMLLSNTSKCYFCVADPDFEQSREVEVICENYDKTYTDKLTTSATNFWTKCIFPKLFQI